MSKKDTSLEKIDPVKLLLFIFAFIIVCFIMIFGFIVPNIKEFKSLSRQNYSQTSSYTKIKNEFEAKFKALEATRQTDGAIILAYDTAFDKDKFINFASQFFSEVSLSKIEEGENNATEKFFRYRLNVTSSLKTPQKFYDFLDALSSYDSIIKAEFPIVMKGENDKIHTTFNIKVFGLK